MKNFLTLLLIVAIVAVAYIYYPKYKSYLPVKAEDLPEVAEDLHLPQSITSLISNQPDKSATDTTEAAPFVPPDPLPKQDNWTWVTTTGKIYNHVQVVKVEADCVTILDSDGGARIDTSTLPPDLQRQLNYTPAIAEQAAAQRSSEMDYTKQKMSAEAAQIKENEITAAAVTNGAPTGNADPDAPIRFQINDLQAQYDSLMAQSNAAGSASADPAGSAISAALKKRADRVQLQIKLLQTELTTSTAPTAAPTPAPAATNDPLRPAAPSTPAVH